MEKAFFLKKHLLIQTNQVRLKSGSQRRPFLGEMVDSPPPGRFLHLLSFETIQPDWPAGWNSSLVTLVASSSANAETAGEIWAFVSVHRLPLAGPVDQLQSVRSFFFPPLSFQTPITRGYYVPFVLLKCSCVCSLSVKQMGSSWPALVSPDSYIFNQISFSSINDKDLHYYKNLRNLWVLSACLHAHTL